MTPAVRYWRESSVPNTAHSFWEPNPQMPRIPDVHLQSVAFIYPSAEAAQRGIQIGGSGFIVKYADPGAPWAIRYVITNQHVLDNGGFWVRVNRVGGTVTVHIPASQWVRAPDDDDFAVANLYLPAGVVPFELSLHPEPTGYNFALTREEASSLNVGPGDEIYMVGRYVAHGGVATNNPIARFGSISLMPNSDELVLDGRGKEVEAYLLEMRSHAGFSGSPVFLFIPQNSFRGEIGNNILEDNTTRFRLLGIDTGHKIDPLPLQERMSGKWEDKPGYRIPHYSDVAIVAPIWRVIDLLQREDFVNDRKRKVEEIERQRGSEHAQADVAKSSEYGTGVTTKEDFEAALRKVSRRKPSTPDEGTSGTSE